MLLALAFYLFLLLGYAWWWFWVLLLLPDVSMVGYLHNVKTGALFYNIAHHKGLAIALIIAGLIFSPYLQAVGLIMLGHSSLDRMLGYGLKYTDSFKHTHLGEI